MRDWQAEDHRQKAKTKKSTSQIDHKQKHIFKISIGAMTKNKEKPKYSFFCSQNLDNTPVTR